VIELGNVERVVAPTAAEFRDRFANPRLPCVIEGALRDWPAMQRWTGDRLLEHYGETPCTMGRGRGTLREVVENIRAGGPEWTDITLMQAPYLVRDIRPMPYFDMGEVTFANVWLGGAKRTQLHYDLSDNMHSVVRGKKRFFIAAPDQHPWLYPVVPTPGQRRTLSYAQFDFFAIDEAKFPATREAGYYVADLAPGDSLYMPTRWYHAVQHDGDPTMAINFWWAHPESTGASADSFFDDRALLSRTYGEGTL
jgi:hypothetical protein